MASKLDHLVGLIHKKNEECSRSFGIIITGAGVSLTTTLLMVPGGSSSISFINVPYSTQALDDVLYQQKIEKAVCQETAILLAKAGYEKVLKLNTNLISFGIGITGSLVTNRERRGKDQAFVALYSDDICQWYGIEFDKNIYTDRREEDLLVTSFIVNILGEVCNVNVEDLILMPENGIRFTQGKL